MIRAVYGFLSVTFLLSVCPGAEERVKGAGLIEGSGTVEELLFELAKLPLEKKEIEWFLRDSEVVLSWAGENGDQWIHADDSDRPLDVIRAFPVWNQIASTASEMVATLAKLLFLREYLQEPDQLKGLKSEIAQMKKALESGRLTGYVREMAEREIEKKQQLVDILEVTGPRNLKLYMENQGRIDPVLDRFGQIGE